MKLIKVAGACLNQTPRAWKNNLDNILDAIDQAKQQNVSILCLQEMSITSYGLCDNFFCLDVYRRSLLKLKEILPHTENLVVTVGLPFIFNNSLYNAIAVIVNTELKGFALKQKLANDGIHYESRWFKAWTKDIVQYVNLPEFSNNPIPIGDIHFNVGGTKIGIELCEEAWVADRHGSSFASKGCSILLNPSCSHFAFDKQKSRKQLVMEGSRAFNCTYIYSNLLGNDSGRVIYDGSCLIASNGELVADGKRFSFEDVVLTTAIVDVDNNLTSQIRSASFNSDIVHCNNGCISCEFQYPIIHEKISENYDIKRDKWEYSENLKHEECTRALGLGLLDYMRKSHSNGFVISLSGGCDSALVTYACYIGIRMAINELGIDKFIKKYIPYIKFDNHPTAREIINKLISTAYQSTENSGDLTKTAARKLAEVLNVNHYEFDVQPVFNEYLKIAEQVKNNKLSFESDDITLQNLQARTRSPSIWILANMFNKLLLTTSNMSEAAVGYCTANGDLSGGIAPIAGLSKTYIREYLEWIGEHGPEGHNPIRQMRLVTDQQPTAELRPAQYKQTDEDDLMPYYLLHKIEVMAIKNRYSPKEIYLSLRNLNVYNLNVYENNELIDNIIKFFKLFSRNQWKREQIPLSFHMDDHNLDPKTWCREPILTGGYEEELEELEEFKTIMVGELTVEKI